jgi:NAD(P)-dependent dehydrogenase (short-subunit alcohol dehydrogenase family)
MQKKVIVLGGSSGIGKATAQRFANEGCRVLVASPDLSQCTDVIKSLPGEGHLSCELDVRSDEQLENLKEFVIANWADFDILVNSIGISKNSAVLESDFSSWDNSIQVMLYGTIKSCRALVPLMTDYGRIIHITSIHHERVASGSSAYGISKAAITQLTRSLAMELAPRNILANTIAPGFVDTPMSVKENGINELNTEWFKSNYQDTERLPLKRAAMPEEVAGVAWFLAGPDASYITGSIITVDGGLTLSF